MKDVIDLPWQTQVVFVSGYLGYAIAYAGRRAAHSNLDAAAIILTFGAIALGFLAIPSDFFWKTLFKAKKETQQLSLLIDFAKVGLGLSTTIIASVFWRRKLRVAINKRLSKWADHNEDGLSTGWSSIIQEPKMNFSTLVVTKKNGEIYESYPLGRFENWPNGACVLGTDGSVGLYVTSITAIDGSVTHLSKTEDSDGFLMTFIPKEEISEVDLRRKLKTQNN